MSKRNIVFAVLAVLCMTVIFILSSRPGEESQGTSDAIEMMLGQLTVSDFDEKSESELERFLIDWRVPIRKGAHACEYALLSILIFLAVPCELKLWITALIAGGGATLYGISDEIHQIFVPGRTAMFVDVLIDAAGSVIGCLLMVLIIRLKRSRKKSIKG